LKIWRPLGIVRSSRLCIKHHKTKLFVAWPRSCCDWVHCETWPWSRNKSVRSLKSSPVMVRPGQFFCAVWQVYGDSEPSI
jgi:hypothetical protein